MTRILHTIDTTGPGGAETVFVRLVTGLDVRHFQSLAAIGGDGWISGELRRHGIEPLFFDPRGGFDIKYLLRLVAIIREYRIELVQSHLLGSNLYCSLAGLICGVPVISTFHGFVDCGGNARLMSVKSSIINRGSGRIAFVSDRLREHFVREYGFSPGKSITIYNGIDPSIFHPAKDSSIRAELGLGPDHILIGAVGNLRPSKGYEYLVRAAGVVCRRYPSCRFAIAGEGAGAMSEALTILRKELGLEGVIFFLGFRGDAPKLYNNCDIYVLPSISEGFSISTIEAMACGLPVVVTRCGGPEEIIVNKVTGIVVDPENESSLADGIIRLLEDRQLMARCSAEGSEVVRNRFALNAMIDRYADVYNEMMGRSDL